MSALLDGIRGNKFAVFGRAGMDMFAEPVGTKSEHATSFRSDLGGSSANICAGLVKLGSQAALVTSVSDDAVGRFCVNRLRHYGVDTRYVRFEPGECRTSLAVYESTMDDFQNVIYRNNAADFQVTEADMERVAYGDYTAHVRRLLSVKRHVGRIGLSHVAHAVAMNAGCHHIFAQKPIPLIAVHPKIESDAENIGKRFI